MNTVRLACVQCDFVFWDNPVPVAAAVLLRGEELVLVRPNYMPQGRWGLPGGFVEKGERAEDAVVREIFEETNLKAEIVGLIGTYAINRPGKNLLYIAFHANGKGGKLSAGSEIAEIATAGPSKALNLLRNSVSGEAVADWISAQNSGSRSLKARFS
ncbi:MAG: NUDIX domain-containing protein, partial [Candidatus Bathyarchaeia archaeon]